jgi:alpha-mannosidase
MLLNMDRNSLWGSAGGMVFETDDSWDVHDRIEYVAGCNRRIHASALASISPEGTAALFFNPLNWERRDPILLDLPKGQTPRGSICQETPGAETLCYLPMPALGVSGVRLHSKSPARSTKIELPQSIETRHYSAQIDPKTGALVSLKLQPSGREMLGGPSNVLMAEKPKPQKQHYGDFVSWRPDRTRLASSSDHPTVFTVSTGPLATIVEATSEFLDGKPCRRVTRFYKDFPRIDFEAEVQDIPDITVVLAEFTLAGDIEEVRRGIPCGFSHGAWSKPTPELHGWTKGIVPAIRWIDYTLAEGAGVAILDRGLTGRELNGRTSVIYLMDSTDKYYGYPNAWLSGKGLHHFEYALLAHGEAWREARIPQRAWEYNSPPTIALGRKMMGVKSFARTSGNVVVEVIRREGAAIEMRLVECFGLPGVAEVTLDLPHQGAALTDLRGRNPQPLDGDGPTYRFPVRPQQIVTLHFHCASTVDEIKLVTEWDKFVPEPKRAALHAYGDYRGHPPTAD